MNYGCSLKERNWFQCFPEALDRVSRTCGTRTKRNQTNSIFLLRKYFIETAYICQRSLQLQLHNFLYWKNSYFCSFYSTFNLKWLCNTKVSSRGLYSRSWRKFLVFNENGSAVVKLLTTLVLLALMAPLDKNSHVKTYFFGSKTLILYDIYYGKLREFKDYLFPFSFFLFFS